MKTVIRRFFMSGQRSGKREGCGALRAPFLQKGLLKAGKEKDDD
jgi:hypothetical protein